MASDSLPACHLAICLMIARVRACVYARRTAGGGDGGGVSRGAARARQRLEQSAVPGIWPEVKGKSPQWEYCIAPVMSFSAD